VIPLGWGVWQFGLRVCRTIRERCNARAYLTKYSALWMGDSWYADGVRPYALVCDLHWVTAPPDGLVPAAKPARATLGFRLWMDPLQTTFTSSRDGDFHLVGADEAVDVPYEEIPPQIGAVIPTLLRRDDSVLPRSNGTGYPPRSPGPAPANFDVPSTRPTASLTTSCTPGERMAAPTRSGRRKWLNLKK